MPKVTLARSLGQPLIKQLGLDETKQYLEGQVIDVSGDAEMELIRQSLVEPKPLKGVARTPGISESSSAPIGGAKLS